MNDQIKDLVPVIRQGMKNATVQLGAILTNHQSIEGHLYTEEEHIAKAVIEEGYRRNVPCEECRHFERINGRIIYGICPKTDLHFLAFGFDGLDPKTFSCSRCERRESA